jgi:hypothetical protein
MSLDSCLYLLYLYFEAVVAGEGTEVLIRPVRTVLTNRGNLCPSIINQWQRGTSLWSEKTQQSFDVRVTSQEGTKAPEYI